MSHAGYGGYRRDDEDRRYGEDDNARDRWEEGRARQFQGTVRREEDDEHRRHGPGSTSGTWERHGMSQRELPGQSDFPRGYSRDYERGAGHGGYGHGSESWEHGGHEHGDLRSRHGRRREDADNASFGGPSYGGPSSMGSRYGERSPGAERDWRMSDVDWRRRHDYRDPDYWQWRNEQLSKLDREYDAWRQERYKKFSEEFDEWRSRRQQSAGNASSSGNAPSSASGSSTTVSGASTASIGAATGMGETSSPGALLAGNPKV
jgi:hypothetical protein